MEVNVAQRVFKFGDLELSDPNPSLSPEQVMDFYSLQYPEMTTSTIDGGTPNLEKGKVVYKISQTLGTKG